MGLNDGWISRPGQFASFYLSTSLSKDYTTKKRFRYFFLKKWSTDEKILPLVYLQEVGNNLDVIIKNSLIDYNLWYTLACRFLIFIHQRAGPFLSKVPWNKYAINWVSLIQN